MVTRTLGIIGGSGFIRGMPIADVFDSVFFEQANGMIPKARSALAALEGGVAAVKITNLDGLKQGTGTTIVSA